jgi:hypothetical protein
MLILDNPNDKKEPTIESAKAESPKAGGDRVICTLFDKLSVQAKAEYSSLMALRTDPAQRAKFKKYVETFRNQAAFHYDAGYRGKSPRKNR